MPTIRDDESEVKPRRPKHEVKPRRPESEANLKRHEHQTSANTRRMLPQISVTSVPETESESLVNLNCKLNSSDTKIVNAFQYLKSLRMRIVEIFGYLVDSPKGYITRISQF